MFRRALFSLRHAALMALASRFRLMLAVLGLMIGSFLYMTAATLTDSWYLSSFREYDDFGADLVLAHGEITREVTSCIRLNLPDASCLFYSQPVYGSVLMDNSGEKQVVVCAKVFGVQAGFASLPIPNSEGAAKLYRTGLMAGRMITKEEETGGKPVAVIPEYAARLLFGSAQNALSQDVVLRNDEGSRMLTMKVVGILRDTANEKAQSRQIAQFEAGDAPNVRLDVTLYIPMAAALPLLKSEGAENPAIYSSMIFYNTGDTENTWRILDRISQKSPGVSATTKAVLQYELMLSLANTRAMVNIVMAFFTVLSGINVMNTMFFTVKDRMPEIGIRKAMGASNASIRMQITLEAAMVSLVGGCLGILCGTAVSYLASMAVYYLQGTVLYVTLSLRVMGTSILLSLAQGILFSLFPAIYASHLPVVKALRLD